MNATTQETPRITHCDCGHDAIAPGCTTGFGRDEVRLTYCFDCCAKRETARMIDSGRATLYLVSEGSQQFVTNWPNTLRFAVRYARKSWHNMARTMTTVYFTGPDGANWSARSYGENTQIAHCRRLSR